MYQNHFTEKKNTDPKKGALTKDEFRTRVIRKFEAAGLKVGQFWFESGCMGEGIIGFGCELTNAKGAKFVYDSNNPGPNKMCQIA
jgi:hypothetical protein